MSAARLLRSSVAIVSKAFRVRMNLIHSTDGVYAPGLDGKPEFFPLRRPEDSDVADVAQQLTQWIPALLKRRGVAPEQPEAEDTDRLARDQPWLANVYAASVRGRVATGCLHH